MLNVGEISLTLGIRRSEGRLYKQNDKAAFFPLCHLFGLQRITHPLLRAMAS